MGEWSKAQNEGTAAKKRTKRDRAQAIEREERDRIRAADLDRLQARIEERVASSEEHTEAVRAMVEGEVYTHDPDARDADDEIVSLRFRQDETLTRLRVLEPQFKLAWDTRQSSLRSGHASADLIKRTATSPQSFVQLALVVILLVALETLFQRRPLELIIRNQLPEASSNIVFWLAIATSVGLVGLSTFFLLLAAKTWGEYAVRHAKADSSAVNASGEIVGEKVSPVLALISTAVALVLQVILFYLRFQIGTSDSAAMKALTIGSALIMMCAAGTALMEYRRSHLKAAERQLEKTRGEEVIDEYLRLHREAHADIPRAIADLQRRKYQAVERSLRAFQGLGDKAGPEIRAALSALIVENATSRAEIESTKYEPPNLDDPGETDGVGSAAQEG